MKRAPWIASLFLLGTASSVRADLALEAVGGWADLTNARKSARAVFDGAAGGPTGGVALRVGLGEAYFVRAEGRFFQRTGERVFASPDIDEVFPLGHPLEIRMIPATLSLARRFGDPDSSHLYAGLGGGVLLYKEESTVAEITTTDSRTRPLGRAFVGFELGRGSLTFAAEVDYSMAPDTIGAGGVSAVYGEDDAGGLTALARIGLRFGQ